MYKYNIHMYLQDDFKIKLIDIIVTDLKLKITL